MNGAAFFVRGDRAIFEDNWLVTEIALEIVGRHIAAS